VTVAGSNGTAPYQYSLNGGAFQVSGTFENLSSGNYTVTVRDDNGCTYPVSVTISQPVAALEGSIVSQTNVSCFNGNNGSVTIAGSNGTGPYQYSINGITFQGSGTFSNLAAGTYNITVRDALGCTSNVSVNITQPATAVTLTINTVNDVSCFGGNDGRIQASSSGGVNPRRYQINGGALQGSGNFTGLIAGSYTVTVIDNNGCSENAIVTVSEPAALGGSVVSQTNVSCYNGSDGSVTVAGNEGTAPYRYSIDGVNFQAAGTFENLLPGSHTITIRDDNGCTTSVPVTITQPASALSASLTSTNITGCFGWSNGSVSITNQQGSWAETTGNYEYTINGWASSSSSPHFTSLPAGTYNVQIRDADNPSCVYVINSALVLTQPPPITADFVAVHPVCFGGTGSITFDNVQGGSGYYMYSVTGFNTAGQASRVFSNLPAGTYDLRIRNTFNPACESIINGAFQLTQPEELAASVVKTDVTECNGNNNGEIVITGATGGSGVYQYSVDNGASWSANNSFTGLVAGSYQVLIRDAAATSCQMPLGSFDILEPDVLFAETLATPASCFNGTDGSIEFFNTSGGSGSYEFSIDGLLWQADLVFANLAAGNYSALIRDMNHPSCVIDLGLVVVAEPVVISLNIETVVNNECFGDSGGSITVSASGGTHGYIYTLFDGFNLIETQEPVYPAHAVFGGLTAGTDYRITVTDSRGCDPAEIDNITVAEPDELAITGVVPGHIVCFGGETGSISIIATGGTGTIWYSVNGVDFFDNGGSFANLSAGLYDVAVRDDNGCRTDYGQVELTQPERLSADVSGVDVTCHGAGNGIIEITNPLGGTGSYEYSVNGADWFADPLFENLAPGTYQVFIRDAGVTSCIIELDQSPVVIDEPALLEMSVETVNVDCNGNATGSIEILATGGNGNYQYRLNGGVWQVENIFHGITAGNYLVEVTDQLGCMVNENAGITEPDVFTFENIKSNDETCFGANDGNIEIIVEGGTAPYIYSIDNGVTFHDNNYFGSLAPGEYAVVSEDSAGCSFYYPILIEAAIEIIIDQFVVSAISCNGAADGSVVAVASGDGPVMYSLDGIIWQATGNFSGLDGGDYTMMFRDKNGCIITQDFTIVEPDVLFAETQVTDATCFNGANGSIEFFNAAGGSGSYEFSIDGILWQADLVFANLAPGNYTTLIRDLNHPSCEINLGLVVIAEPEEISLNIETVVNNDCYGDNGGSVTVSASGGTSGYIYALYNGIDLVETQEPVYPAHAVFGGLTAGAGYRITVTDSRGCGPVEIEDISITEPDELEINLVVPGHVVCFGGETGSITINAAGGTGTIWYSVNGADFFDNGGSFSNLSAGLYDVAVRDDNGCRTDYGQVELTQLERLSADISATGVTCFGTGNGIIEITNPLGGTGSYEYSVNGVDWFADPLFENLGPGTFHVFMRDAGVTACFVELDQSPVVIDEPELIEMNVMTVNVDCNGNASGSLEILATGGNGNYQYRLDGGDWQEENIFSGLTAGNYLIEVTDHLGCMPAISDEIILEPAELIITSVTQEDLICAGAGNGTITINVTGGTGTIFYSLNNGVDYLDNGGLFTGLDAGTYNVVVRDINGCADTYADPVELTQPAEIVLISSDVHDAGCFGSDDGSIDVTAGGGTGSLEYSLDGVVYQSATTFSGLSAGEYTIYVRDENVCVAMFSLTVNEPAELVLTAHVLNTSCNDTGDPQIRARAEGGSAPYVITLYLGGDEQHSFTDIGENEWVIFEPLVEDMTDYMVTVADVSVCGTVSSGMLSTERPAELMIGIVSAVDALCHGVPEGYIDIGADGGSAPFTYILYDSEDNELDQITSSADARFSDLVPGTYYVTITDVNGCGPVTSEEIIIGQPAELTTSGLFFSNVTCNGGNTGVISVVSQGGTGAVSYSIDGGTNFYPDGNFTEISAGTYELVLRDAAGCQVSIREIEIMEPELLEIVLLEKTDFTVGSGNETGSIRVAQVSGGVEPYTYSIDNGSNWQSEGIFDGLVEGTYEIIVRDANLCTDTESIDIVALTGISAGFITVLPSCFGFDDGLISISGQMGTEPYEYSLNDGVDFFTSGNFSGLSAGIYQAVVRDGAGLIYRVEILLEDPPMLEVSATVTNTWCRDFSEDGPDGMISLEVTGGTGDYLFEWSNGSVTQVVDRLTAGSYSVTVTDDKLCQVSINVDVGFEHHININLNPEQSICPGTGVTLNPNVTQSGMAASYSWSSLNGTDPDPVLTPQVFPSVSDIYTFRVTDENSCYNEAVTRVNLHPFELLYIGNDTVIFQGTSLELEAKGGEFISYEWTGPGLSSYSGAVTTATPVNETLYQVYAETANGCFEEASILIGIVQPVSPVSGFTPNDDGVNDFFEIPNAQDYPDIVVEIYTRSGQRVFHSQGYTDDKRWDGTFNGKELPMGTYYFVITLNDIFGTRPVTGPVTIVR
jgi:large repetitive protein